MPKRDQPKLPELGAHLALTREVLRLRRSEQLLREENEELADARNDFAELYDWAPLPLLTLGAQNTIRSANLATAELFERERSWLVGRSFRMLFHELDRSRLAICLGGLGRSKECAARLILANETWVEVLVSRRISLRKTGISHVSLVDSRKSQRAPTERPPDARQTLARRRILLIEDHLETAETMQEVLERHGYGVVSADSIEQAVDVDLARVDAIVSDIRLPDGLGTDLLRQLKRECDVPAIAFSGLTTKSDVDRAKEAGFDLFMTKPVDFPRLLTALGALLQTRPVRAASLPP
jgi:CheY-like chemotaxis protein